MAKKTKPVKKTAAKKTAKKTVKKTPSRRTKPKASPRPRGSPAPITHEMIAKRAYEIWLRKSSGSHSNNSVQNWLEAEAELRATSKR